jgi:hypothetical protein
LAEADFGDGTAIIHAIKNDAVIHLLRVSEVL